jgi:3-oxoacyl-[acyl-carrier protein] reductase
MDLGLSNRVAFVAASSKGMGFAIADTFAVEGAQVGMCARGGDALMHAAERVRGRGARVSATVADVTDQGQASAAVERAVQELGRLDILVVNAGGPPRATFEEVDESAWQRAFRLTFLSGVHLVHAALPALRRSDAPAILFIASWSVKQPIPGLALSNSIRGAVAGMAKTLANELAPLIRVNTLLPGTIRTERQQELARAAGASDIDAYFRGLARTVPLDRIGEADEVARVAVFLCSPAASYVTGQMLAVDGGLLQSVV